MDQELEPMDQILETLRNKIFDCKLALAAEKDRQRRVADVRKMITGDSNYENQSGDVTMKAIKDVADASGKMITGISKYEIQSGDVTKGTVKAAVSAAGAAGAKVKDFVITFFTRGPSLRGGVVKKRMWLTLQARRSQGTSG